MCYVMVEIEAVGFLVVHFVTDNHKVNIMAFELLCNGFFRHCILPENPVRKLFLTFDQCHLIKNVPSWFLVRNLGKDGAITAEHSKNYTM